LISESSKSKSDWQKRGFTEQKAPDEKENAKRADKKEVKNER
jgi:hypothetical protein